jgi:septal ring factor EnvC (AmiA/AmiB activator)
VEDPTPPTERIPPGQPYPAQPTPGRVSVARTSETVLPYDEAAWEELRRLRFWAYFGSAVGALAAIFAAAALVIALSSDNGDGRNAATASELRGLRNDIANLRSDVAGANTAVKGAAEENRNLARRVAKLEQNASNESTTADQIAQIKQEINDLSDRLDQVERAQEEAASGGP